MKLLAVGDVMLNRSLKQPMTGDGSPGSSAFACLRSADLVLVNLEVPLTERGLPAEKGATLRAPRRMAGELKRLGVDACSIATNHALDYGIEGLLDTLESLADVGIPAAGGGRNLDEAMRPARLTARDGSRVAFFSVCSCLPPGFNATPIRPGIAPMRIAQTLEIDGVLMEEQPGMAPFVRTWPVEQDAVRIERAIRAARSEADDVVVGIHWGVPFPWLSLSQSPLAEYQPLLGRRFIDAGASLVVGHHAHCLHPVERYRDGLILYSTGNFVFHPFERPPLDQRRPGPPYKDRLTTRPWFESAIFEVELGPDGPGLRLMPIELGADGEPVVARPEVGRPILARVEEYSRELNPGVRIDPDGCVRWE